MTTIYDLPAAGSVNSGDLFAVATSGNRRTRNVTAQDVANFVATGITAADIGADPAGSAAVAQANAIAFSIQRANHTGTQEASTISDFAAASRVQIEDALVAGVGIDLTPSGTGAGRKITIAASGLSALPIGFANIGTVKSNAAQPNTSIDVGQAYVRDTTDSFDLVIVGTIVGILQSVGPWTPGNNQNKLDNGVAAANQSYHIFIIRKTVDGSTDLLFSASPTAPTMPSGYAGFRRVGSFVTVAGAVIKRFEYIGNECLFNNPLRDINVTGVGATTALYTVGVPAGIQVLAIMQMFARSTAGSAAYNVNTPGNDDVASYNGPTAVSPATNQTVGFGRVYVFTNTSAQIQIAANVAGNTYSGGAYGFVDTRAV